jgi:hypothetical protein
MWRGLHGAPTLAPWAAFMAGVVVGCPAGMPGVADGSGPRTTDLLGLLCAGLLVFAVIRSAELHRAIHGALLVWALTLPWVFMEICALAGTPDPPVQRLLIRWVLGGFSAYLIAVLADSPVLRPRLLWGLMIGVVLATLTLLYDFLTFSPEDMPIEQLVNLAIYNGKDIHDFIYRAFGIFGHPNGAAGCVLVGVPLLIGAIHEERAPRWSIVIGMALIAGVFYLTKSRGPLIVSAALVAYWLWSEARGLRLPLVLAGVAAGLGVVAAGGMGSGLGDGVLLDRFLDFDAISLNAGDRWWTVATSLDLILRNPWGMGSAYVDPLETATGTTATHNAYLELALMGGVPLLVLVVVRLVKTAAHLFTPWRPVEAWLAAYLLGIFLFESYFLQVSIQLTTLWLVISPLRSLAGQTVLQAGTSARARQELAAMHAARDLTR